MAGRFSPCPPTRGRSGRWRGARTEPTWPPAPRTGRFVWSRGWLKDTPKVRVVKAHQGRVRALAWSPQGGCLASGGRTGLVKLWDPIRVWIGRLQGHQHWVLAVAWSPTANGWPPARRTSASLPGMWRPVRNSRPWSHYGWGGAVAWSPDGDTTGFRSADNSVRVGDPSTGQETFVLRGNSGRLRRCLVAPRTAQLAVSRAATVRSGSGTRRAVSSGMRRRGPCRSSTARSPRGPCGGTHPPLVCGILHPGRHADESLGLGERRPPDGVPLQRRLHRGPGRRRAGAGRFIDRRRGEGEAPGLRPSTG